MAFDELTQNPRSHLIYIFMWLCFLVLAGVLFPRVLELLLAFFFGICSMLPHLEPKCHV